MKNLCLSHTITKVFVLFLILLSSFNGTTQTIIAEIPEASFDNLATAYNHTYWKGNFKNTLISTHEFINQSSDYKFNVSLADLNFKSLDIEQSDISAAEALRQADAITFSELQPAEINYKVYQDGAVLAEKSATPTNLYPNNVAYAQLPEFGTFCNRRFLDSINFSPALPNYGFFTGVEFVTWSNRFVVTFRLRPRFDIENGQLALSVEMPAEYADVYSTGDLFGFEEAVSGEGFVLKKGASTNLAELSGNTLTVITEEADLFAGESYEVSLIFYPVKANLESTYHLIEEAEQEIIITAAQTLPVELEILTLYYNALEGVHEINTPGYIMGQYDCSSAEKLQDIDLSLENPSPNEARVRLRINVSPSHNVTGFSTMIRNENGDPSGLPLQVSKNWHGSAANQQYGGGQITQYTEIIIPANTTVNIKYTYVGAKWGETYAASSHQLSLVGYANTSCMSWLESAIGSFGESITHSPDYAIGNTNAADWRPFLVTNEAYGGISSECHWTGNVGGMDIAVYINSSGDKDLQTEPKTGFLKYGPNLTETTVSFLSADKKIQTEYTFYLNRSDDFNRVYYKVKVKALDNVDFDRFDFFQLGGDFYRTHLCNNVAYGNSEGLVAEFLPTNSGINDYTTEEIPLLGENPWLWAGDGEKTWADYETIGIKTNNGFIIRSYDASFGGSENDIPYLRERSSDFFDIDPTSYCLVPPPGITSFETGDSVEFLLEAVILPKQASDYYGPNYNFLNALETLGNSWKVLQREASGNDIKAYSLTNEINESYPLSVKTIGNEATLTITGGRGYIPIVFTELTAITNPQLWYAKDSCWQIVDQSNWGKDFWQSTFSPETGLFELIFNVNQDLESDSLAHIKYHLGPTPPEPEIVTNTRINELTWTIDATVYVTLEDSVVFSPTNTWSDSSSWSWTGPGGFTASTAHVSFKPVAIAALGVYTVTMVDTFGCLKSEDFEIKLLDELSIESDNYFVKIYPNPTTNGVNIQTVDHENYEVQMMDLFGRIVFTGINTEFISVQNLSNGTYNLFVKNLDSDKVTVKKVIVLKG